MRSSPCPCLSLEAVLEVSIQADENDITALFAGKTWKGNAA